MANYNIWSNAFYQRLLDELQNEDHFDALEFVEDYDEEEDPETIKEIIDLMQQKASIVRIYISGIFLQLITHETIVAFFDAIVTLPNLQEIWTDDYDGEWQDCNPVLLREFVTKLLLEGRKLTVFGLRNMDVGDEIGVDIVQQLQKLKTLEEVMLCDLNLGNKSAFAIADWLKDSSSCLERIDLQDNPNIGAEGWEAICNTLENNFVLKDLVGYNSVMKQRCEFYLILNRKCNRNEMMRSARNDDNSMLTRNKYINNMIETFETRRAKLQLSMAYYWIRTKPFFFTNC